MDLFHPLDINNIDLPCTYADKLLTMYNSSACVKRSLHLSVHRMYRNHPER